ncbi:hypothetical protein JRC04_04770 [Mycolicibacterium sp. S2-37]|uniref:hypothetical protein n=1 Tax=Mycolicibacterium sp. S2-37 TaxID=2810297 RepID=UPI001A94F6A6|nr:hypothetical protein [Mycolicibacterium sp. S2-37]MBO0676772.1 hypothetical protein [Mycolicibacterium sp. S2-37]
MSQPLDLTPDFVVLRRKNPNPPMGVFLETFADCLKLAAWARSTPEYTCRLTDRQDGTFEVQIEGVTTTTANAREGQWVVLDGNDFLALDPSDYNNRYEPETA